jgi:pimeloyl-ACP methyl ester carboxylesterase
VLTEREIDLADSQLNVATGPKDGPPLWLFHGLGRRWQDFGPILADLTSRWSVNALDHRGHGRSERSNSYRAIDYVADAARVVRLSAEPAILIGHSLGALVSLSVAAQAPESVRAIVLLDPPGADYLQHIETTPYAPMWRAMQQLAGRLDILETARELADLRVPSNKPGVTVRLGDLRDGTALRFMARCLRDLDPATLTLPLEKRLLDGYDMLQIARSVCCPVLLLVADLAFGGMLPPPDADPLVTAISDCTRIDLPGTGHLVHWQNTAATLRLIHGFLGSLP